LVLKKILINLKNQIIMNDAQRSKIMRGEKLVVFLGDNAAALAPMADVADAKTALENKIVETNNNDNLATADTTGIAEAKNAESAEMVDSAMKLGAFLQIHARNTNNKELMNMINFRRSELTGADDNKRRNAARFLGEQAQVAGVMAALGALAPTPYLPADLTAHLTNVDQYDNLIGRPHEKRSIKSAYTKAVARNIIELDDIVANLRIDMAPVQFLNLTLFDQFEAAALIDDAPSGSNTHFVGTIDPDGQRKIDEIVYDPQEELQIENTSTVSFQLSFRNDNGDIIGTPIEISSGETKNFTYDQIAPEGTSVWLKNMSSNQAANYILDLL
jgi:hypothetical protein